MQAAPGTTETVERAVPESFEVGGVKVTPLTVDGLHSYIEGCIQERRREAILHVNAHAINLAQKDPELRAIFNGAHVVFCDGFGIRLAARLLGRPTPPRVTYADWIWLLAAFCAARGFSLFLLGSRPGTADEAARRLVARCPCLRIAGTHHGYFEHSGAGNDRVREAINSVAPDVLLVAFGMPLQEKWIAANLAQLRTSVALTGGACLDYAAGMVRRGPAWMVDNGLEWLARLLIEPARLWRRYLLGNPRFLLTVLDQRRRERKASRVL